MTKDFVIISPYCFPGLKEVPDFLKPNFYKLKQRPMNQKDVLEIISENFEVTVNDILSISRKREVVDARYVYFAAMKLKFEKSLADIGKMTCDRDHTTVIHGLKAFKNRYDNENKFKEKTKAVFSILDIEYDGRKLTASK
jgi:chromosomal replication initiator protein